MLVIAGIGPFLAAGTVAATLGAAAAGGAGGAVIGGAVGAIFGAATPMTRLLRNTERE
jgi:hypothetical protein